jgi:transposase
MEDIKKLKNIRASRTEAHARVVRARMLLTYAKGDSINSIARREKVSRPTVDRCVDKALAGGVDTALDDLPRSGRPPNVTAEAIAWVVNLACSKPTKYGYAAETWTIKALSKHVRQHCKAAGHPSLQKAGKSAIHGILKEHTLHPHKFTYYLERRDPEFEKKMAQVLFVYQQIEQFREMPADQASQRNTTTLSFDEKPGIQAILNIAPDLPPLPGSYPSTGRDYEYKRLGTVSLLAGFDLHTGHILTIVRDRHRSREFIEFLELTHKNYPKEWKIRIVLDNHSSHISKETVKWLKQYPNRFEFVFTPKHGSWLNMIEMFFSKMTRSFLRGIRVKSKQELIDRIYLYIKEVNDDPVIFRWKYKLNETLV